MEALEGGKGGFFRYIRIKQGCIHITMCITSVIIQGVFYLLCRDATRAMRGGQGTGQGIELLLPSPGLTVLLGFRFKVTIYLRQMYGVHSR